MARWSAQHCEFVEVLGCTASVTYLHLVNESETVTSLLEILLPFKLLTVVYILVN